MPCNFTACCQEFKLSVRTPVNSALRLRASRHAGMQKQMTVEPTQATSCSARWRARIKSPRSRAASCSLEPKQKEQKSYPMLTDRTLCPSYLQVTAKRHFSFGRSLRLDYASSHRDLILDRLGKAPEVLAPHFLHKARPVCTQSLEACLLCYTLRIRRVLA